jgi:peptidoglycan/xylan/chitin deacetylase (PgdA/CDA1 family)
VPLLLWFDDGLENTYIHAFPVLEEYGYKATDAIISGLIGDVWDDVDPWGVDHRDKPMMTWEMVKELIRAGWSIQSHGLYHYYYPDLTINEAEYNLWESKRLIKENVGVNPTCFVWPWGGVNYRDVALTYYKYLRTIDDSYWQGDGIDIPIKPFGYLSPELVRAQIRPHDLATILNHVNQTGDYAVLLIHSVLPAGTPMEDWEYTVEEFRNIVEDIYLSGVPVETYDQMISRASPLKYVAPVLIAAGLGYLIFR